MRFSGKVAIVTGCARGIGEESARRLCSEGAQLIINDLSDGIFDLERALKAQGHQVIAVQGSVTDYAVVETMVSKAVDHFGKIDILVNTVALPHRKTIMETPIEEFDHVINVNLKAIYYPCKAVIPHMIEKGYGRIVNISSVAGIRGGGLLGKSTYACTKGAVTALSKGIAREVAPHGITCNVVCPGFTKTPRNDVETPESIARILKQIPLGRGGEVSEIAPMILHLASDDASFMTGTVSVVDGGTTMI